MIIPDLYDNNMPMSDFITGIFFCLIISTVLIGIVIYIDKWKDKKSMREGSDETSIW